MGLRGQTTEERIAEIAKGFASGIQGYRSGLQSEARALKDVAAMKEEAAKRQAAIEKEKAQTVNKEEQEWRNTAIKLTGATGKVFTPEAAKAYFGVTPTQTQAPATQAEQAPLVQPEQAQAAGQQTISQLMAAPAQPVAQEIPVQPSKPTMPSDILATLPKSQKTLAQEEKKKLEGTKQQQKYIDDLRKEVNKASKTMIDIDAAANKIMTAPETAAGDQSLIFAYMRILDPSSTVREGEFATAEQARGVPESVMAQYNKAIKGERLTPAQRMDFKNTANKLAQAQYQSYSASITPQVERMKQLGVGQEFILPKFSGSYGQQPTAPGQQAGSVDAKMQRLMELRAKAGR